MPARENLRGRRFHNEGHAEREGRSLDVATASKAQVIRRDSVTIDNDITRWAALSEGQFFERKSAFDRPGGQPKGRPATTIAWDVVETLSAMANAAVGVLLLGKFPINLCLPAAV